MKVNIDIPKNWELKYLGDLGKVINGLTYSPDDIHEDGVLVLRSSNVLNRSLAFEDKVFVNVGEGEYNPVLENDILICVRNGSRNLIGKNTLITKEAEYMAFGAFMTVFRSPYNKFLFQVFDTDVYNNQVYRNLGATINSINGSDLKKFKVPFPPKEERDKITEVLGEWDKAIYNANSIVDNLKLRKKGLMQQVFSGELRLQNPSGKSFPDWKAQKLGHYLKVSKAKNLDLKYGDEDVLSVSGEFGIVNQIEFHGRSFAGASVANYGVVETGDIVYTKSPLKANPYGIIKVNKGVPGIVSTLYAIYKCKPTVNGEFVDYYFQLDDNVNRYLRPLVQKGTKNDLKINNEKVLIDKVLFPSVEEQAVIVDFFKTVDQEITETKNYLETLKTQKKGLMQKLLTGEVRVKI